MKVSLYAVLDSVSGVYDGPVPAHNDGMCLRSILNHARKPDSPLAQNPECFSVWRVGRWDDATGQIIEEEKKCLGHLIDLLKERDNA